MRIMTNLRCLVKTFASGLAPLFPAVISRVNQKIVNKCNLKKIIEK